MVILVLIFLPTLVQPTVETFVVMVEGEAEGDLKNRRNILVNKPMRRVSTEVVSEFSPLSLPI